MEETEAKAMAARGGRGGYRTRGGRSNGGSCGRGKKKAQSKSDSVYEEDTSSDPALMDTVRTQYPDPIATDSPKPYYSTLERESPAHQRDYSVAMQSTE